MNIEMDYFDQPILFLKEETYKIIGIAMEVHRQLGGGFAEIVYKDALVHEFEMQGVPYQREREYAVHYKGIVLPHKFYADFVLYDKIIVEVKAKKGIIDEHYTQVINYLAVSKLPLGLLLNFHGQSLEYKRIILTK
jgi:GxxExxY protein